MKVTAIPTKLVVSVALGMGLLLSIAPVAEATPALAQSGQVPGGEISRGRHTTAVDPAGGRAAATDAEAVDPGAGEKHTRVQGAAEPGAAEPGAAEPGAAEPGAAEPGAAGPGATGPGTALPGTGGSGPGQPEESSGGSGPADPAAGSRDPGTDGESPVPAEPPRAGGDTSVPGDAEDTEAEEAPGAAPSEALGAPAALAAAIAPRALGTVTGPPAGSHFTRTVPGDYATVVPSTILGSSGEVCAVTITALAAAGGNANDTTSDAAGNYMNGAGAAARATYAVKPGMAITGHVGQGGRFKGETFTDPAFQTDLAGYQTMNINYSTSTQHSLRARASGGTPDGGFGGSMPGAWWGNIRHVGAGGGGSSLVRIASQELVMVGGGGGNGGGHQTSLGIGGDGGQPVGAGVTAGVDGTDGLDSKWYQSHTEGGSVGNINENLGNSGGGNVVISWTNPTTSPDWGYVPGGGQGGRAAGPGTGGLHRINGNADTVIPLQQWTSYPNNLGSLRNQRNSLLHGFSASGRTGGSGGNDRVFFRGIDPVAGRRTIGNPDSGGGGGGGYFGGGGGASTISYGLSIRSNRGITGGGGGGGASFVSPGVIATAQGNIGPLQSVESGLGPKALSNRDGADGFVALTYSTDCGSAWKTVDLAPMSPSIVNETGAAASPGQTVKYTLHFKAPAAGSYAVNHVDQLAAVLDDADWVGNFRYGNSATVPAAQTGSLSPGVQATFNATAKTVAVTGTVPAGQIRTVSFETRVKANFPDRLAASSGDYMLKNFLGEPGTPPPPDCVAGDPMCTVNPILGSLRWTKVDGEGAVLAGAKWRVTGPAGVDSLVIDVSDCSAATVDGCSSADREPRPGHFEITGLAWGVYTLVELEAPPGYELNPTPRQFTIGNSGGAAVAIHLGEFENVAASGSASWSKTDPGGELLSGSAWRLSGPAGSTSADLAVSDCVASSAAACPGPDVDHRAGKFRVSGLAFGNYTLVETAAPAGFVLDDTPRPFTVGSSGGSTVDPDLGNIVNQPQSPLEIPLTGGLGSYGPHLLGGSVVALLLAIALIRARRTHALLVAGSTL